MFTWPTIVWVYWVVAFATLLAYTYVFTYGQITSRRSRLSRHALSFAYALAFAAGGVLMVQLLDAARAPPYALGWTNTLWWWVAAALTSAAATLLLGWALFADRSRGRKRCPRCWYDMADSPTLTCPECGRDARRPDRLLRTRRRPCIAALAVLLNFAAVALGLWPHVSTHDLDPYTPDWVILVAMPYAKEDPSVPVNYQWPQRLVMQRLTHWWDGSASLANQLREDRAPWWKRKLALWSAGASMRSTDSAITAHMGLMLAEALGDDAAAHAHLIENLSSPSQDPVSQLLAIQTLATLPVEAEQVRRSALRLLGSSEQPVVLAAITALAAASDRQERLHEAPRELLELCNSSSFEIANTARGSLGSFATSREILALLEDFLQLPRASPAKGRSIDDRVITSLERLTAIHSYLHHAPDSSLAHERVIFELRNSHNIALPQLVLVLNAHQWAPQGVVDELTKALEQAPLSWTTRESISSLFGPADTHADWNRRFLLHLSQRFQLRVTLVDTVAALGPAAKPLLPDLRAMLEQWESEGDAVATRLESVIREVESLPAPAPPPTPSSSR